MAALFPPQNRDGSLPPEANLTPRAAERVCREATQKSFDEAARSLNRDWQVELVGVDGGRYQSREKDPDTDSRWREDKGGTVSSYLPGDGTDEHPPRKLLTTHVATAGDAEAFGQMIYLEAERRGLREATGVTLMGDCANWIDPLHGKHFGGWPRIADYQHAVEHLWESARAALGADSPMCRSSPAGWKRSCLTERSGG